MLLLTFSVLEGLMMLEIHQQMVNCLMDLPLGWSIYTMGLVTYLTPLGGVGASNGMPLHGVVPLPRSVFLSDSSHSIKKRKIINIAIMKKSSTTLVEVAKASTKAIAS